MPISIVALSGDELQRRQLTTLEDLPSAVPGLAITATGSGGRFIEVRGISNQNGNEVLRSGLYLDEADITLGASGVQINSNTLRPGPGKKVLRGPPAAHHMEKAPPVGTIRLITRKAGPEQICL